MSSSTPCPSRMIRSCRRREMTSFWDRPSSTTGMRTGPRAGWSSGFLRRGSTCPSPHRGRARDEEKTREGERKGVVHGMSTKKLTRIDRADSATPGKISPSPPPPHQRENEKATALEQPGGHPKPRASSSAAAAAPTTAAAAAAPSSSDPTDKDDDDGNIGGDHIIISAEPIMGCAQHGK